MTPETEIVIAYFKTHNENTVPKMAKALNLPQWKIHKILDNYFASRSGRATANKSQGDS